MFSDKEIKEMLLVASTMKAHAQVSVGDLCWFRNEEFDETDVSGGCYPFFVGEILATNEEEETVDLKTVTTKFGCNEAKYTSGPFTLK